MSSAEPAMSEPLSVIRAAMDIGSNSIKLLVLELSADGSYRVLSDRSRVTGLGRGVSSSGELSAQAVADTLACIRELAAEARALGSTEIRAAATAAMRSASNPEALLAPLRDELGIQARVISGEEEAELSRAVSLKELARLSVVDREREAVFFDLGGGSTELTRIELSPGSLPEVRDSVSLALGARRMTELAGISYPVSAVAQSKLLDCIQQELAAAPVLRRDEPPLLAGLGGTASVLVWLRMGMNGEGLGDPHGAQVSLGWIEALIAALAVQTRDEVLERPNLDPLRADIIYAGAVIIAELLRHYRASEFMLLDRGLRYGLLLAG